MAKRILVVERDEAVIGSLAGALRQAGLEPVIARDRAQALETFSRVEPAAVVIAVDLGAESGVPLASVLRTRPEGMIVPILFLGTGAIGDAVRSPSEALGVGADYFFQRPVDFAFLAARIRAWTGEEEPAFLDGEAELITDFEAPSSPVEQTPILVGWSEAATALVDATAPGAMAGATGPVIERDDAAALVAHGEELAARGERASAVDAFEAAAGLYASVGRREDAISMYRRVLEIDPARTDLISRAASIAMTVGRASDAVAFLTIGLDQMERQGDLFDASEICRRILAIDPRDQRVRERLDQIQWRLMNATAELSLAALRPIEEDDTGPDLPATADDDEELAAIADAQVDVTAPEVPPTLDDVIEALAAEAREPVPPLEALESLEPLEPIEPLDPPSSPREPEPPVEEPPPPAPAPPAEEPPPIEEPPRPPREEPSPHEELVPGKEALPTLETREEAPTREELSARVALAPSDAIAAAPLVPPRGTLSSLAQALRLAAQLYAQRATGILHLHPPREPLELLIADGHPAGTRDPRVAQSLLTTFTKLGRLPPAALAELLEPALTDRPRDLCRLLLDRNLLRDAECTALLERHLDEALLVLLRHRADWSFEQAPLANAELYSTKHPDPRTRLIDLLPRASTAAELAGAAGGTQAIIRVHEGIEQIATPNDTRFLALLDGRYTLDEAIELAGIAYDRALAAVAVYAAFNLAEPLDTQPVMIPEEPEERPRTQPPAPSPPPRLSVLPRPWIADSDRADRERDLRAYAELVRTSDYFTILGVDPGAPAEAIAAAHRRLRKSLRPDDFQRNPELYGLAREVLRSIDEAWDVLSVPELRSAYQQHLKPHTRS